MADFWSNIWSVIWLFFWVFAFIVYLMAIFNVILDLFRDSSLNGWYKAIWVIFLVFLPFLTVLIYLIARGRGMAQRRHGEAVRAQQSADTYIREVAGTSTADEIDKAKTLLDAGAINAAEFEALKAKALS